MVHSRSRILLGFLLRKGYTLGIHTGCNKYMLRDMYMYIYIYTHKYMNVYLFPYVYINTYILGYNLSTQTILNAMEISELLYDFFMHTQFSFTYLVK